jgi:hypothetical protein|tara:strand:- start:204 stop:479 length:276 start_codon:yes stop_codon:yes gene_type:complete
MFTLELYKADKRKKSGERLESKTDGIVAGASAYPLSALQAHYAKMYPAPKYRFELHETMVTSKNMMNGKEFQERYDTPYYCSPSSETYWSM